MTVLTKHGIYKAVDKFTKVFTMTIELKAQLVMNPGLIHVVITKTDSLVTGYHNLLPQFLRESCCLAKADYKNKSTITNDERDTKTFYSNLIEVI